jgi:hypothetical protein
VGPVSNNSWRWHGPWFYLLVFSLVSTVQRKTQPSSTKRSRNGSSFQLFWKMVRAWILSIGLVGTWYPQRTTSPAPTKRGKSGSSFQLSWRKD